MSLEKVKNTILMVDNEDKQLIERNLLEFGLSKGAIKVWDDAERGQKIVIGFTLYELCKKHNIVIEEQHIEKLHFDSEDEAIFYRARVIMAARHFNTVARCVCAIRHFNAFASVGKKRMSGGAREILNPDESKWDTMAEIEKTFHISRTTIMKFLTIKNFSEQSVRDAIGKGEMSIAEAYRRT